MGHVLWLRDFIKVRATGRCRRCAGWSGRRAVSSVIIGPLTMDQLEIDLADDTDVSCDLLARIDGMVPPGHTVWVADDVWSTAGRRRIWR